MQKPFFSITTPIYYVNDEPHIGHTYTTLLADVFARYQKRMGYNTWFLTGTDEHGQKVETSAKKRGVSPIDHCNQYSERFKECWKLLDIQYDRFIRTTDEDHIQLVQKMLQRLWEKGELYSAEYEGLYYVSDEVFVTEAQAEKIRQEKPNAEIIPIQEKNYFFKMSQHIDWLIQYIEEHPDFIQPSFRKNEVLGFLKQEGGVKDLCISRPKSRLTWGIELPFDTDYICYVWVDALLNYVSGAKFMDEQGKEWYGLDAWKRHPADLHLIGKDILTTHCVYWPTLLHALDLPLPKTIFAHGWWLIGGEKMSKSLGNVIRPADLLQTLNGDVSTLRYLLLRGMIIGHDATLTEERMKTIVNGELANDLGNLFSRISKLVHTHYNGNVSSVSEIKDISVDPIQPESIFTINAFLDSVLDRIRAANKYFDSHAPWALVKQDQDKAALVFIHCLNEMKCVAYALEPILTTKMQQLLSVFPKDNKGAFEPFLGGKIGTLSQPLFPRIDFEKVFAETSESSKNLPITEPVSDGTNQWISMDEVKKVQLITAVVRSAERVEGTNKLLKLLLDDGSPKGRQIVAGIAEYYRPQDLISKTIIIVANLQPVVLKGVPSEGMLLAAKADGKLVLLTTDAEIGPGAKIS
ncbi:MAG: methionine--tRNA ligase [bacterium]|nr:methionine--tRNA ligase [bacterium]